MPRFQLALVPLFCLFLLSPLAAQDTGVLEAQTWICHVENDLIPFWTTPEALGTPVGNFPTVRGFDGRLIPGQDQRLPRMLGRQIYFYSMAYLLTGRQDLLTYAQAGVDWLIDHGWDKTYGGWYGVLSKDGKGRLEVKYSQDMAYAAQGLAAYFFVTRDPRSEEYLLKTRNLMFDPQSFWDEKNHRVRDGMTPKLTTEVDQEGGGWELVSVLDQVNAYLLAVQPVLTRPEDRAQWADDLQVLGGTLIREFWNGGIFWGQKDRIGQGGRHIDFGHTFKSYWMVNLIDQNLGSSLSAQISDPVGEIVPALFDMAFDPSYGHWGYGPRSRTEVSWGSSWWIWAECDQWAQTWNLETGGSQTEKLKKTMAGWLEHFVDRQYGEVVPDILRDGSRAWPWEASSTGKVGEWKNGFHSMEHALMSYLHDRTLAGQNVVLHFAAENPTGFLTKPYFFPGRETARELGTPFTVGTRTLTPIRAELKVELRAP